MKRRVVLVGVATLVLLVVVAAFVGHLESPSRARFPSSFAAEPEGSLAFRRLLESLDIPTSVRTTPWDDLEWLESGMILVTLPLQREVDDNEDYSLRRWLGAGGALLVIDDATQFERSSSLDALLDDAGLGGREPVTELDLATLRPARPPLTRASGTTARPSSPELHGLTLHADSDLNSPLARVPLAIGDEGAVLAAEGAIGNGRVVRVMGPVVANDHLLEGDNLEFVLRLVDDLRNGGTVRFDEYHHGYGGFFPVARKLDKRSLLWALVQLLLVTVLYIVARGVRFGPVRRSPPSQRRSSLEFVHSMASLYRRGGSRSHVLNVMIERFAREARGQWGLRENLGIEELARQVSTRAALPVETVAAPLQAAYEATLGPEPSERRMVTLARPLARLHREVFGGDRSSP